jgi:RHS repeat-associated protein
VQRRSNRVKQTINGVTTYFVGGYYELTGSTVTKYYFAGATRVAMRKYTIPQSMSVEYVLGDHPSPPLRTSLGSTSITTDANGTKVSEMRYKPWGEIRSWWTAGLSTTPAYELAKYTFTGQYSDSYINLLWYGSRHYDPLLGRFISPDSIIPNPGNPQSFDRYAYVYNNPVNYTDPSGHIPQDEICRYLGICGKDAKSEFYETYGDELGNMLWDTDISWGSLLMWNNGEQVAMLVLLNAGDEGFYGGLFGVQGEYQGEFFGLNELTNVEGIYAIVDPNVSNVFDLPRHQEDDKACESAYEYGFYQYSDESEGWWVLFGAGFVSIPFWGALAVTTAGGVISMVGNSPLPASTQYSLNHSFGLPWSNYPIVYRMGDAFNQISYPSGGYQISFWRPQPGVFPSWNNR